MTTEGASSPNPTGKKPSLTQFAVPVAVILIAVIVVLGGLRLASQLPANPTPVGAAVVTSGAVTDGAGGTSAGTPIADLSLQEFGGPVRKLSELKKKVLMINFWASWCEACMVEMPSIVKLREAYKDKGFEVVALNLDENPQAAVPGAVKKMGMTFPVFTDPAGAMADRFDVHAIPVSVFIDSERRVLLAYNGERDWNNGESRALLDKWLAGRRD